jgi:hypothetical protein
LCSDFANVETFQKERTGMGNMNWDIELENKCRKVLKGKKLI